MSSRLFQEVREKRGLAYSVYSFSSQHADTGMWGVYAGCLPAKADEVLAICRDEVAKVIAGGLTDEELDRGKGQLRGSIVLGPGGPVLPDEPARQGRAGLPAAGAGRRDPGRDRGGHRPTTCATVAAEVLARPRRWPSSARSTTPRRSPHPLADRRPATGPAGPPAARRPAAARREAGLQLGQLRQVLADERLLVGRLDGQPGVHQVDLGLAGHVGDRGGDLGPGRPRRPGCRRP